MGQTKVNKAMAAGGLLAFGGASILANVLSVDLPVLHNFWSADAVAEWQATPKKVDVDGWAYFWAVLFPIGALAGIEFVSRFTALHNALRYGVLGLASLVAVVSSYLHIVHVLLWYGQGHLISIIGPIAIDGLMILCTLQFLAVVPVDDATPAPVGRQPTRPVGEWAAPSMSSVPLGPAVPWHITVPADVPAVPAQRPVLRDRDRDTDKPARSSNWDRAEAARLIMSTDMDNHAIGAAVGTSYKTIQRLRRDIKESEAMTEGRK